MANREIKFRAWYFNEMQCCFHVSDEGVVCNCYYGGWGDSGSVDYHEDAILMQYTGLKDKNGKEIYEGDIIKRHTGYLFKQELKEFKLGSQNDSSCFGYNHHPLDEVIGNIYESPELL